MTGDLPRQMLSASWGSRRFAVRAAGVALHDGHVLVHRVEGDDFWALPGGRVEFGEFAADALAREMQEELGVTVRVERLLWVVELHFGEGALTDHELGLYFLMTLPEGCAALSRDVPIRGQEDSLVLLFEWLPLARLEQANLYPEFLRTALAALPAGPVHVAYQERLGDEG